MMSIALNEHCGELDSLERKVIGPTSSNGNVHMMMMSIVLNEHCGELDSLERKVIGPTSSNVRMMSIALDQICG